MNVSGNWNQTSRSIGKIKRKIQLFWGKAHVRIQENEETDTLAKEAATKAGIIECYR
jgi:ribonuclease HI